jgi:F0F1-type ATP synthase membrane subunit b/b'
MTGALTVTAPRPSACEFRRKLRRAAFATTLILLTGAAQSSGAQVASPVPAIQEHQPEAGSQAADHATTEDHAGAEHGGLGGLLWPVANFIILAGALYYFLRTPFTEYLAGRSEQIRRDLLDAAELNRTASAQLAEVDRKLKALPDEIAALKKRGRDEITAEEERISSAAAADRARLLTQTRREIDVRLQAAQRELSEHAATLALQLARERLGKEMTAADHVRLVERYVQQVKES